MFSKYCLALVAAACPLLVESGIQSFDLELEPTDQFVHYNDGYVRGPGYIDLSGLTFTATSEAYLFDDLVGEDDGDFAIDDAGIGNTDDSTRLLSNSSQYRQLDGGIIVDETGTAIDIAVFPLPANCANTKTGCDWAELGVGMRADDGTLRWCCTGDECEDNKGRLIIDAEKFQGSHRFVTVPEEGPMSKKIRFGKIDLDKSAKYIVLYANCDPHGRRVEIQGESVWKSKHGYLPGELYGFMCFYTFVTAVYALLFVWFGALMHMNEDSRIEIEKWILFSITLGLLEMIFRTGDYFVWNADGVRSSFIIWIGILAGVLKQGISRCLIVMVSLGWGVVRDSLGSTMRTIVILGLVYIGTSAAVDLMLVFAIESINRLTLGEEKGIFDVVEVLTFVKAAIDAIFIMWILDALSNTTAYLENMNQSRKLDRFLKLRTLFMFSVLFAVVWAVFAMVNRIQEEGIVEEENEWAIDASTEVNYLFVLVGVAYLWRPNESAKEYAYVMELPASSGDNENELELTGAVPSALDDDDDEAPAESDKNGYYDEPKSRNKFEIS